MLQSITPLTHFLHPQKVKNDHDQVLYFFTQQVFTILSNAISHVKEDKISFAEKKYSASKNAPILNHAEKMA